jgi:hypothetical protein
MFFAIVVGVLLLTATIIRERHYPLARIFHNAGRDRNPPPAGELKV